MPVDCFFTHCWRNQFAIDDELLRVKRDETLAGVRRRFVQHAMNGYNRLMTFISPDPAQSSMFLFRTRGEMPYFERLCPIPADLLQGCRRRCTVSAQALCFTKPQPRMEFRFTGNGGSYWTAYTRNERRNRNKQGFAVPYQ